jgi:hypothetical protein
MANLNSESCHSLIGFQTPEYLGFLKLQVVSRFTGTGTCIITRTRKPEPGYLNLSINIIARWAWLHSHTASIQFNQAF